MLSDIRRDIVAEVLRLTGRRTYGSAAEMRAAGAISAEQAERIEHTLERRAPGGIERYTVPVTFKVWRR